jgi:hypothetical protein
MNWEYCLEQLSLAPIRSSEARRKLEYLGDRGWELVAVGPQYEGHKEGTSESILIFKRPKSN